MREQRRRREEEKDEPSCGGVRVEHRVKPETGGKPASITGGNWRRGESKGAMKRR
jgi:hypothetical protein